MRVRILHKPFKELSPIERKALQIYYQQKYRSGVKYTFEEFSKWYAKEFFKKKWILPDVARFDHNKPYSFDNIELQERVENTKERNQRLGNPGKTHKAVVAILLDTKQRILFSTKLDAAAYFKISEKTVYNHCSKRTKLYWKYGPSRKGEKVTFRWAK